MREIEFRGKRKDTGEWVYGYYAVTDSEIPAIYNGKKGFNKYGNHWASVNPDTVGQYTGLNDKNGVKIFEGDIIKLAKRGIYELWLVMEHLGAFCLVGSELLNVGGISSKNLEVIGNIHDNPELLEARK